jgi:hypothetical protein
LFSVPVFKGSKRGIIQSSGECELAPARQGEKVFVHTKTHLAFPSLNKISPDFSLFRFELSSSFLQLFTKRKGNLHFRISPSGFENETCY